MSLQVDFTTTTHEERERMEQDLCLTLGTSEYASSFSSRSVYTYELFDNTLHVPFSYGVATMKRTRPSRDSFTPMKLDFNGQLREEQKKVKKEVLGYLNKTGSVIISARTGFGKTISSINIACTIKLKTVVLVKGIVLVKQWKEAVEKYCPDAVIQTLTAKSRLNPDIDIAIVNAQNVPKFPYGYFSDFGLCIVDELHLIVAEEISKSLIYVCPRYLIGLSATPFRYDDFNPLIKLHFGINQIIRKLNRPHTVYKIETGFRPTIETTKNNRLNWNTVLTSLSENPDRNRLIVDVILEHPDRCFLVLCKRVTQAEILNDILQEEGENVSLMVGSEKEFDKESRILIGTTSKLGTGFDHPKLNALMLATDIKDYYIQILGRVMRTEEEPIIFDLIDNHKILKDHFNVRRKIYSEHGGVIKTYKKRLIR